MSGRTGRLVPTSLRQVGGAALCGAAVAALLLRSLDQAGLPAPLTPWVLVVLLALCTVVLTMWARAMARAVRHQRVDIDPGVAMAALACAKVAVLAGAVLAGFHLVYVLVFVRRLDIPLPRERVIWGTATILVSVAFAYAGKLLEKACADPGGGSPGVTGRPNDNDRTESA